MECQSRDIRISSWQVKVDEIDKVSGVPGECKWLRQQGKKGSITRDLSMMLLESGMDREKD